MRHKSQKCRFYLCEQTVKGSKQDNRDKPGKDQRVLIRDYFLALRLKSFVPINPL